jgi:hypothetical protein
VKEDRLSCRCTLEGNKREEAVGCLERCVFCPVSSADEIYRKFYAECFLERSEVYCNIDTNCARMYGFAFCAVDAIYTERNLRCHETWAQTRRLRFTGQAYSLAGRDTLKHVSTCSRVFSGIQ